MEHRALSAIAFAPDDREGVPLVPLRPADLDGWLDAQPSRVAAWLRRMGFRAEAGSWQAVPAVDGDVAMVVAGVGASPDLWALAGLPRALPEGLDLVLQDGAGLDAGQVALAWALGCYRFDRYRPAGRAPARLVWPSGADRDAVTAMAEAVAMARDLINTPAEDLGPAELAAAAGAVARAGGAEAVTVVGDSLCEGYACVHMVGRASSRAPRVVDFSWGEHGAPKVTLVGKGVCFDTGGLDLKTAAWMERMKKDMGGAACVLAVARMVIEAALPVNLRVIIPAVDNAVDGNAYHPMDIVTVRNGMKIEIGDTDAEGRVILADALCAAAEGNPDLLIDMATLTGDARTALGPDIPAVLASSDELARELVAAGAAVCDPLWPMPMWKPYAARMASDLAEINTIADWDFADHIHAALFLQRFVGEDTAWLHVDTGCWNIKDKPGRPKGGEAMGARAVFELIKRRYGA
jgi:leucyl aminopeptidase